MQVAQYEKDQGNEVGFEIDNPDKAYIFCVFKDNRQEALEVARKLEFQEKEFLIGGAGVSWSWLPEEIQKVKPDYTLYNGKVCTKCGKTTRFCKCKTPSVGNMDYSLGFTSRGCIRKCGFCIVSEKEGRWQKWQHPSEFHNQEFKKITLLDNNLLANKKWFFEVTDYLLKEKLVLNEHGFDLRLVDKEIAERLKELKFKDCMHFAFDSMQDEEAVRKGLGILKDVGINIRRKVQLYVLVGYNTTEEEDKYRCRLLKELGTNAFVMPYTKNKWTNKIGRWCNRKWTYWAMDIDEYDRSIEYKMQKEKRKQCGLAKI